MTKMNQSEFWREFAGNADKWASLFRARQQQHVFDEIDALLTSNGYPFCFDITENEGKCCLIFSPEGDYAAAESIDSLIKASPLFPEWRIVGRRQKKNLSDTCAIVKHLYLVDPLQCQFRIVKGHETVIEMFIPDVADLTADEREGLGNTFLWHALGEEFVMDARIKSAVFLGRPRGGAVLSAIELIRQFDC